MDVVGCGRGGVSEKEESIMLVKLDGDWFSEITDGGLGHNAFDKAEDALTKQLGIKYPVYSVRARYVVKVPTFLEAYVKASIQLKRAMLTRYDSSFRVLIEKEGFGRGDATILLDAYWEAHAKGWVPTYMWNSYAYKVNNPDAGKNIVAQVLHSTVDPILDTATSPLKWVVAGLGIWLLIKVAPRRR